MAENIYDPPLASGSAPPEPSGVARTMGILSIVFGGLDVLSNLWEIASQSGGMAGRFGNPRHGPDLVQMKQLQAAVMPYVLTRASIMIIMSVALIVIGAMLLKQKGIARRLATYWSLVGFAVLGFRAWLWESKVWPKMEPFMRSIMDQAAADAAAKGGDKPPFDVASFGMSAAHSAEFVQISILAVYAILLLMLMSLSSVKERLR